MNAKEKLAAYFIKNNVPKEDVQTIVEAFSFRKIEKNTIILHEGEICKHIYFSTKGIFRIYGIFQEKERTYGFFCGRVYAEYSR